MKSDSTKTLIAKALNSKLRDLGWSQETLRALPSLYLGNTPISPYFLFSGLQKMKGDHFLVRGAVGLISRAFEREWPASNDFESSSSRNLATLLDILNLPTLNAPSLVSASRLDEDVARFCHVLDRVLRSMPSEEGELQAAIRHGDVAGIPWSHFENHLSVEKYEAFEHAIKAR